MNDEIAVTLAGLTFPCQLRYPESARYFQKPDPGAPRVGTGSVSVAPEDWRFFVSEGAEETPFTEYSLLCFNFSDALLPFDRVLVHGVALCWRGRAWLICADSGVGKSTQARCLQELRPGEFGIICGDRPILEFQTPVGADAHIGPPAVLVHPSPWNGKENWRGAPAAPLAGLILLERGEENRLVSLTEREAALPMFSQFIQTGRDPENIRRTAALATKLLRGVPIWKLTTFQVPDSTELLLESVFK